MVHHLSDKAIRQWRDGCLDGDATRSVIHHIEECDECLSKLARSQSMTQVATDSADFSGALHAHVSMDQYSAILDRVMSDAVTESQRIEGQRATAGELVAELAPLSPSQQRLIVRNSDRYQGWGIAEELLDACRANWSEDPRRAENLAEIAIDIIDRIQSDGFRSKLSNDLRAEAWSCLANCRRIQANLNGASAAFQRAELFLAQGTGDTIEQARLFDLKASFYLTSGRYEEAGTALRVAIEGYKSAGDAHLEGRTLLNYAKLLYESGNVEQSIPVLERAEGLIDTQRDPHLGFLMRWKKLLYLTELGRDAEASQILPEVRELAQGAPRVERLRFLWTEALLCRNLGQVELSEQLLVRVREGFIAANLPCDVARISLDLAASYLKRSQHSAVRKLAVETMSLFASMQADQELFIAWRLFQTAAEQETATLGLLDEVATRIRAVAGAGS